MLIAAYAASAAAATTTNTSTGRKWEGRVIRLPLFYPDLAPLVGGAVDRVEDLCHHQSLLPRHQHFGILPDRIDEGADFRLMHLNVRKEDGCRVDQRFVALEEHFQRAGTTSPFGAEQLGGEDVFFQV